jgi:hypothetical protein
MYTGPFSQFMLMYSYKSTLSKPRPKLCIYIFTVLCTTYMLMAERMGNAIRSINFHLIWQCPYMPSNPTTLCLNEHEDAQWSYAQT